jgi:hypothetical protein
MATNTVHPPAASNPAIALSPRRRSFVFFAVFIGAVVPNLIALVCSNAARGRPNPAYW